MSRSTAASVLGIGLCGLVLVGYVVQTQRSQAAAAWYAAELARLAVREHVIIDGTWYEVTDGIVQGGVHPSEALELAYHKTLVRQVPLMALPGIAPDDLRAAVERLRDTAETLSAAQSSPDNARYIRDALYPLRALTALADLEDARLQFLQNGSKDDAAAYEASLRTAITTSLEDLQRFRGAVEALIPDGPRYASLRTTTDKNAIRATLASLASSLTDTRKRAAERLQCLRGSLRSCTELYAPAPANLNAPTLTTQERELSATIRTAYKKSGYAIEEGPLVLLSQSWCAQPDAPALFAFVRRLPKEGIVHVSPLFVGDVYFLNAEKHSTLPYLEYFARHGVSYTYVNPLSYYVCLNSAHDISRALAVRTIGRYATDSPVSRHLSRATTATILPYETQLRSTDVVSEADARAYLAAALSHAPQLPVSVVHDLTALSLQLESTGFGLYHTALDIELYERFNTYISEDTNRVPIDMSATTLFFVRSAFAQLFMAPPVEATGTAPADTPYISYRSLMSEPQALDLLQEALQFDKALHSR